MGRNDPGSKSAVNKGCTCPVMDNHGGKGIKTSGGEYLFWMDDDCPLHGSKANKDDDPEEELLDKYLL